MNFQEFCSQAWESVRGFFFHLFYESYLAQILLLLVLLSLPFCLRALRRIRILGKIKRLCRSRGFAFVRHRPLAFLGNFKHAECEYSIVTKTRAWAIKLIGAKRRGHQFRFLDETNLEILKNAKLMGAPLAGQRVRVSRMPSQIKWYPHPQWEFFTYAERQLPTESVLLCIPAPGAAAFRRRRETAASNDFEFIALRDGARFWEMVYHTPDGFLQALQSLQEGYRLYQQEP